MVAKQAPQVKSNKNATNKGANIPSREELLDHYRQMLLIRRFEEKAGQLYGMGLIAGFCHLYIGQEAVVVGIEAAQDDTDSVITSYRDHGHMLAAGIEAREIMAELTGRSTGCSRGKGGSMHMFSLEKKFYGGHGIVGAQVSLGTGLAFAHQYTGDNGVSIAYFGDGAANQGQIYESFNMASLWKLPVVYVIENNQYAMGTSVERSSAEVELYKRGISFDIKGEAVDGMNVLAVKEAATRAIEHARSGQGPYLLEMKTYRYRGHSMSDPAKYRPKDESKTMRDTKDPIDFIRNLGLNSGAFTEDDLKIIDKDVKEIVADAAEFAQNSPEPELSELMTDIYL